MRRAIAPELAVLSALAHGQDDDLARAVAIADQLRTWLRAAVTAASVDEALGT